MKKITMITAMLLLPYSVFAANTYTPDLGQITATIGVKNTTSKDVTVTCTMGTKKYPLGEATVIKANGDFHPFTGTVGDGCGQFFWNGDNKITCTYNQAEGSGTFTVGACQNTEYYTDKSTNSVSVSPVIQPPTPYKCDYSYASYTKRQGGSGDNPCSGTSNKDSMTATYCTTEAYFAVGSETTEEPTYTVSWNNIHENLAKGQAMAAKLGSLLAKNFTDYAHPISSYDGTKLKIIFPPKTNPNPNPYAKCNNLDDCRKAYSG